MVIIGSRKECTSYIDMEKVAMKKSEGKEPSSKTPLKFCVDYKNALKDEVVAEGKEYPIKDHYLK